MKTPKEYIIGFLFALAMLALCSLDAQVLPPPICSYPVLDTGPSNTLKGYHLQDTIECIPATCAPKTFGFKIPPMDGCVAMNGTPGSVRVVLMTACNDFRVDSCIPQGFPANPVMICFNSPDTVQAVIYGADSAFIVLMRFLQAGQPSLPPPFASLNEICNPTALDRPHPAATPTEGYTDLLGRYWQSQPIGISFSWALHRKVLKIE